MTFRENSTGFTGTIFIRIAVGLIFFTQGILKYTDAKMGVERFARIGAQPTDPHITPTAVTGAAGYLWMLGTYPCETGTCPVLMRSTDGGRSWVRVGSPPSLVDAIDSRTGRDGYAYFRGSYDERAKLYWTGNGGRTWRLISLRFPQSRSPSLVIASGRAYLLVPENCLANGECRSQDLASSAVTSDVWTMRSLRLPVGEAIEPGGLGGVWVKGVGKRDGHECCPVRFE